MDQQKSVLITQKQFDLLSNALRSRIMYVLKDRVLTAKQVAEQLGESPGNVHYHIQKLFKGGLIDLVDTKEVSGILEKYYQSVGDRFELNTPTNEVRVEGKTRSRVFANFRVDETKLKAFIEELSVLLSKWEQQPGPSNGFEVVFDSSLIVRNGGDTTET